MDHLTPSEEEAMQALWQLAGGFVKDVLPLLPAPPPPYTTLASTLRNLERKGFVRAEKLGNSYRFVPLIAAADYRQRFLSAFVGDYYQNSYKDVVSFFAQQRHISAAELKEIIDLIEKGPAD